MKKMMSEIFIRIIDFSLEYDDYDVDYDLIQAIRYIKDEGPSDKEYLKYSKLYSDIYFYNSSDLCFVLAYQNEFYFVLITKSEINTLPYFLVEIERNVGLLVSAIYHSGVRIKKDIQKNKIFNDIAYQHSGRDDYSGHSFDEIQEILDPINVYKINNYEGIDWTLERILGSILSLNNNMLLLEFGPSVSSQFANSFQYGSNITPYNNLIYSVLSNSFEHSFLELYKCIESLFQVTYAINLYNEIKPHCNLLQFLDSIEKNLKWRPIEHKTVKNIIKETPTNILSNLSAISGKDKSHDKLGEWFYDVRNRIVHLKQIQNKVTFTIPEWNDLILFTLLLIEYWFKKYEGDLNIASKIISKS